jgi:hypothetical protein
MLENLLNLIDADTFSAIGESESKILMEVARDTLARVELFQQRLRDYAPDEEVSGLSSGERHGEFARMRNHIFASARALNRTLRERNFRQAGGGGGGGWS